MPVAVAGRGPIADALLRQSSTGAAPVFLGETSQPGSEPGRPWARHRRWAADGTWDRVLGVLLASADGDGLIDWRVAVDPTITRAHQHATNTRRPEECRAAATGRASMPTESPPGTRSAVPAAG